jgi:hypothetical protein
MNSLARHGARAGSSRNAGDIDMYIGIGTLIVIILLVLLLT